MLGLKGKITLHFFVSTVRSGKYFLIETEGANVQEEERPVANKDLNGRTGPLKMANFRSDFVAHRSAKLNGNDDFGCTYLL